jgi:peptide subunit release factor 1 (eRF1)
MIKYKRYKCPECNDYANLPSDEPDTYCKDCNVEMEECYEFDAYEQLEEITQHLRTINKNIRFFKKFLISWIVISIIVFFIYLFKFM